MNELTVKEPKDMTAEELGGEIRMLTQQAKTILLNYGIQIGYRLYLAKEKVENFAEWVERETEFSKSSAYRYIQLYTEYGSAQGGLFGVENVFPTLGKLSISNALRLLSVPEEEREEFAAKVDAEHISARELEQAIRERDEARKALEEAEQTIKDYSEENVQLTDDLADAEKKVKELASRPVEVAVQTVVDEDAVKRAAEDARAAEMQVSNARLAAMRKELDTYRKQLDEAEKKEKAARERAEKEREKAKTAAEAAKKEAEDAAAKARAEAEQAKKEAEELRKKLISAESGAGEAAIFAKAAQENFFAAINKIEEIGGRNEDTARKLADGIISILEELTEAARELRKGME